MATQSRDISRDIAQRIAHVYYLGHRRNGEIHVDRLDVCAQFCRKSPHFHRSLKVY